MRRTVLDWRMISNIILAMALFIHFKNFSQITCCVQKTEKIPLKKRKFVSLEYVVLG
jgi:hypothetical protein